MMKRLTLLFSSAALSALIAGTAAADDTSLSNFLDRAVQDVKTSFADAQAQGWRNEARNGSKGGGGGRSGRDDDDRDDDDDDRDDDDDNDNDDDDD